MPSSRGIKFVNLYICLLCTVDLSLPFKMELNNPTYVGLKMSKKSLAITMRLAYDKIWTTRGIKNFPDRYILFVRFVRKKI